MESQTSPDCRVIVVGTTGSGKSTLAEQLSMRFGLEFIELDALHWLPNWNHVSDAEFRIRIDQATRSARWVVASNYGTVRDISWPRAEAVIWLDHPLWTIFWRLWQRTWRRWWSREILWSTNHERLWPQLKIWSAEDSLFHWLFKTYWRRNPAEIMRGKREYPLLFALPEYSHLNIIHFQTPRKQRPGLQVCN